MVVNNCKWYIYFDWVFFCEISFLNPPPPPQKNSGRPILLTISNLPTMINNGRSQEPIIGLLTFSCVINFILGCCEKFYYYFNVYVKRFALNASTRFASVRSKKTLGTSVSHYFVQVGGGSWVEWNKRITQLCYICVPSTTLPRNNHISFFWERLIFRLRLKVVFKGAARTLPEHFENAALGLPSTLIRHENGAERFQTREIKNGGRLFVLVWTENIIETKFFDEIIWNLKWLVLFAFSNFSGAVWTGTLWFYSLRTGSQRGRKKTFGDRKRESASEASGTRGSL